MAKCGEEDIRSMRSQMQQSDKSAEHVNRVNTTAIIWQRVRRFICIIHQAWRAFVKGQSTLMAAALSFYGLVSLVPLSFFLMLALSRIVGTEWAYKFITQVVSDNFPHSEEVILNQVDRFLVSGRLWLKGSLWGALALLWSGLSFFETLDRVINAVWGRGRMRGYFKRKLMALLTFIGGGIFFAASLLLSTTITTLRALDLVIFGIRPSDLVWFWRFVGWALPYVLSVMMFFLVYKFLPMTRISTQLAFRTACVVGVIWEGSKFAFAKYVAQRQMYHHLYGPLTSVVLLMLWIFFSALLLVFGAHIVAAYHRSDEDTTVA